MNVLLHPKTEAQLAAVIEHVPHALILAGPTGLGKSIIASELATNILKRYDAVADQRSLMIIATTDKSISIDTVRELEHFLRLRVPSQAIVNRIVIIEDSHLLTTEAQNALLKTLEEPPRGTMLILTTQYLQDLLPTLQSRSQSITIEKPSQSEMQQYFQGRGFTEEQVTRAIAMSGGLPGLASALLHNDDHPMVAAVTMARQLLTENAFGRLKHVDEMAKQKTLCKDVFTILTNMAHVSLLRSSGSKAKHWQAILTASHDAMENLEKNVQIKLLLIDFMLQL